MLTALVVNLLLQLTLIGVNLVYSEQWDLRCVRQRCFTAFYFSYTDGGQRVNRSTASQRCTVNSSRLVNIDNEEIQFLLNKTILDQLDQIKQLLEQSTYDNRIKEASREELETNTLFWLQATLNGKR